jgi:hypothetical protein
VADIAVSSLARFPSILGALLIATGRTFCSAVSHEFSDVITKRFFSYSSLGLLNVFNVFQLFFLVGTNLFVFLEVNVMAS